MFKIKYIAISLTYFLYSLSHFTCQQSNAQNSITQASIVPELRTCNVEARFRQGRGIRDQIANIHWITEKAKEFQKNIYFCFIDYTKVFDYVDHNKLWKILKEMGIPEHFTCLLRNVYAGQEAVLESYMEQPTGFKLEKG